MMYDIICLLSCESKQISAFLEFL